jgi:prolyl oligopeptidase
MNKMGQPKSLIIIFCLAVLSSCQIQIDTSVTTSVTADVTEDKKFELYLDELWESNLKRRPVFATRLGDKRFNNKITSNTVEEFEKNKTQIQIDFKNLNSFNFDDLSEENQLNYRLKHVSLSSSIELSEYPSYFMSLNQRGGVQSYYETGDRLNFTSKQDYNDWLTRLSQYSNNIENSYENNKAGIEAGYTQPKLVTSGVISQIEAILDSTLENHPYLQVFLEADEMLLTAEEKETLVNEAKVLITEQINPAYTKLHEFLINEYLPNSRESIGIKDVPNGKSWYEDLASYHTTTKLSPDEIHAIGLKEIKRIRQEMETIISDLEWDGDFQSFLNYLRTSPRFYYDNPEDLFNAYLIMAKTIDPLLPKIFKVFPRAPYGVIPIPAESAPYTTTAYYNSASKGKPGYFYANLYKPESRPKYEIPVLTVHEAVPGHHFQISIAQELKDVPTFRKYLSFTAFVEGWGLYSEELGEYMNLYDDPYDKFGQLTYDMWRAIRLVVDTGMHYKNWSRDDAINLFLENTAKSQLDIENEVDRYIAWPGQALAYKIGQLKILELRTKAEKELGDDFDIKDFHHEILKRGSLPLSILETYINEWIYQSKES